MQGRGAPGGGERQREESCPGSAVQPAPQSQEETAADSERQRTNTCAPGAAQVPCACMCVRVCVCACVFTSMERGRQQWLGTREHLRATAAGLALLPRTPGKSSGPRATPHSCPLEPEVATCQWGQRLDWPGPAVWAEVGPRPPPPICLCRVWGAQAPVGANRAAPRLSRPVATPREGLPPNHTSSLRSPGTTPRPPHSPGAPAPAPLPPTAPHSALSTRTVSGDLLGRPISSRRSCSRGRDQGGTEGLPAESPAAFSCSSPGNSQPR